MRNKRVLTLAECAIMIALAFALSYVRLWKMPLGGSITLCSMLPIMLIAVKHGTGVGLGTAFVYSLTQLAQGLIEGDVSAQSMSADVFVIAVLFDYIVPFTALGLCSVFGKSKTWGVCLGMGFAVGVRFICHFITGVTIWRQWTPEGWNSVIYSFAYNGGYLIPDLAICLAAACILLRVRQMRKLLNLQ